MFSAWFAQCKRFRCPWRRKTHTRSYSDLPMCFGPIALALSCLQCRDVGVVCSLPTIRVPLLDGAGSSELGTRKRGVRLYMDYVVWSSFLKLVDGSTFFNYIFYYKVREILFLHCTYIYVVAKKEGLPLVNSVSRVTQVGEYRRYIVWKSGFPGGNEPRGTLRRRTAEIGSSIRRQRQEFLYPCDSFE